MSDCIDLARSYRSRVVTFDEVKKLHNSLMEAMTKVSKKSQRNESNPCVGANGAIVFAMAGPTSKQMEFALVANFAEEDESGEIVEFDPAEDMKILLRYADPVGVVMLAAGTDDEKNTKVFRTFPGKSWAKKYAKRIIDQAYYTLPMYTWGSPDTEDEAVA